MRPVTALALFAASALTIAAPSAGKAQTPNPYLKGDGSGDLEIGRVLSFGDSYSKLKRKTKFTNWVEQMRDEGEALSIAGYGVSGATAANVAVNGSTRTFRQQFNKWRNAGAAFGDSHATAVYFGYNDINNFADLTRSRKDYSSTVTGLINNGAIEDDRYLFVFQVHDWGKNPGQAANTTCNPNDGKDCRAELRERTQSWNAHVAAVANKYNSQNHKVIAVDLFTAFDRIVAAVKANPTGNVYGLTNVTTADSSRSNMTALFDDDNHFGRRGQDLIQQVFSHYLTRGWNWANSLAAGAQTATQLVQDIDQGIVFGLDGLADDQRLGLNAFTIGEAAAPQTPHQADVSRASYAQAYQPDERPDGGVGVNYGLSPATSLGVAIGHYTDSAESSYELSSSTSSVSSDAVAFYLTHRLGGFDLRSRFSISDDNHATNEHDELIGVTSSTSFGGRTTELAQRAGYPLDFAGATWTPWAEMTRRVQEIDSYSIANPYLSDVTYSGAEAGETLAGIGLDARFEPLELSDAASLRLHGGLAYTHSLSRDDYVVQTTESAGTGPAQEQRIERDPIRQLALTLGGSLELGDDLSIGAEVALAHAADEGSAQQAQLRVQYRF